MKHLAIVLLTLLVPTAVMAGEGPCKADKEKFCGDVKAAGGDMGACMKQHASELSSSCKAKMDARWAKGDAAKPD
jgi:hypothetical protein